MKLIRDIPPSLATAIAEGNLDPTTMEAYECSQRYKCRQSIAGTQRFERSEVTVPAYVVEGNTFGTVTGKGRTSKSTNYSSKSVSAFEVNVDQENLPRSCFTVYSSKNTRGASVSEASKVMVERPVLKERNLSDEASALALLASPLEVIDIDNLTVSEDLPLNTPDNNPFRKRKCFSEDSETPSTPMSVVTECDQPELKCLTIDSQESVNSKLKKFDDKREDLSCLKKPKTSKCKSSENRIRNGSILNFFGRL